jgi:16S rRNA (guanine966-N2)-methyltransferase
VRIIAGTARGRPLRATAATRPTADLIKGAIFSMLEALAYKRGFEPDEEGALAAGLAWPRVLDLFAGSGALGIEALSRGARTADLVELHREAARIVEANLRATGLSERARIHVAPIEVVLSRLQGPFDVAFADPPYADSVALRRAVELLAAPGVLQATSVVVLEQPATDQPPDSVGTLPLANTRRHGRTRVSLYGAQ